MRLDPRRFCRCVKTHVRAEGAGDVLPRVHSCSPQLHTAVCTEYVRRKIVTLLQTLRCVHMLAYVLSITRRRDFRQASFPTFDVLLAQQLAVNLHTERARCQTNHGLHATCPGDVALNPACCALLLAR